MTHQIHGGGLGKPQQNYIEYLYDLNVRKDFLRTQKGLPKKKRMNKFDYIKLRTSVQDIIKRVQKQAMEGQRCLTKGLYP